MSLPTIKTPSLLVLLSAELLLSAIYSFSLSLVILQLTGENIIKIIAKIIGRTAAAISAIFFLFVKKFKIIFLYYLRRFRELYIICKIAAEVPGHGQLQVFCFMCNFFSNFSFLCRNQNHFCPNSSRIANLDYFI